MVYIFETESKVLENLRNMDRKAIQAVYKGSFGMCKSYILGHKGTDDDAKDVFQEAMIVLFRNLKNPEFNLQSKVSTYLYSVARNLWLKNLRDNNRLNIVQDTTEVDIADDDSSFELEREKRMDMIGAVLEKIGKECKDLIKKFYYDSCDLKSLAEELGYSYKFIRVKKVRCMNKVKDLIKEQHRM